MKNVIIRIEPSGIEFDCQAGETIIQAAWRHGYYWPTICGGVAECGACRCELTEGVENAEPPSMAEQIFFRTMPRMRERNPALRLACCLKVSGVVTIRKAGVKPA